MRVEAIPETGLGPADAAEISALLDLCFDGGFAPRSYFRERPHLRLVARDGGRIVGQASFGLRLIRQGEALIEVATLAEVAVAPERRREGCGAAMIAQAIAVARGGSAAFLLLFGTAGVYHRAGFRPAANSIRRVDFSGRRSQSVIEGPVADLMVLPLGAAPWDGEAPIDLLGGLF